jgi:putative transposase
MKLVLPIKLAPSAEQTELLLKTTHQFNAACNEIAETAFQLHTANKIKLQKHVYYSIREKYGLPAQLTIRAISKVAEAYKRDKSVKPTFKPESAMIYDPRIMSFKGLESVSLVTVGGRVLVPMVLGTYQKARIGAVRGQADLIYRNGVFYLYLTLDVPESDPICPEGFLGVDLGIVNIAVDSDGTVHSGKSVNRTREKHDVLRAALQSAGTKSAKRHLKHLSGRTARFCRDVNHCISKHLVAKAKDTGRGIALENLKGIRDRKPASKAQRRRLNSWGFYQLRQFIEYKSRLVGVPVVLVDPAYTSQACPNCGFIHASNRPDRNSFICGSCGFAGSADHVAAVNIAARAVVNPPIVACSPNIAASPRL